MRTTIGTVFGFMLVLALGCGSKKDAPPDAKLPPDDNKGGTTATPVGTGTAVVPSVPPPPPPKPAEWEMDPSKHAVPTTAAAGKLGGAAFAPEVQIQGNVLTLRVLKDMNPEREITVALSPAQAKAVEGLKLVVKPDQPSGPDVPEVTTLAPDPKPGAKGPAFTLFVNAYAMTLEFGKKADGKLPGKIYLSLGGEEKNFVAGAFTAEWVRPPSVPPAADEGPFVHGSVGVVNYPSVEVSIGYVGAGKTGMLHIDMIGISLLNKGSYARSDQDKPRATVIAAGDGGTKPGRYDHTRLEPGRYLFYARAGMTGPALWEWVTVEPNTQKVIDFALDGAKAGKVEVTVPAGTKARVSLVPPGDPANPLPAVLINPMAFGLGLSADPKDDKVTFPQVSPGKYEIFAGELRGTVTVEVGKTATVALTPPMKK